MQELTKRQKQLLRCLVLSFTENAIPVGSDHLVKQYRLKYSSATVRNEMAALEEMGFIQQPHTSSGRVPSDLGYRLYVNNLMRREAINHECRKQIEGSFCDSRQNLEELLRKASYLLSSISNELAVVLTPWMCNWIFDRMEFLSLSDNKMLVVIRVQSRQTKTVVLEVESNLKQKDLNRTAEILNERLSGLRLDEIKSSISDRLKGVQDGNSDLLRRTVNSADALFDFAEPLAMHTSGTQNMLRQPEFSDHEMMGRVLSLIESRNDLLEVLLDSNPEPRVSIGQENPTDRLQSFSVVKAAYTVGNEVGTIGVVGPVRMPYRRILPLVEHMAATMSALLR